MTGSTMVLALKHLLLHVGSRGASAILSLLLFALFAREYPDPVLANVFAFGFLYGFAISTTRIVPQLVARIPGAARRSVRLRLAQEGVASLKLIILPVTLIVLALAYQASTNVPIALLAAVIFPFAVADVDIFRSVLNRSSLFSFSFSIGSALALIVFHATPSKTQSLGILVITLQWLPVGLVNLRTGLYMLRNPLSNAIGLMARMRGASALAIFDGCVINLPFLSFWAISETERISMSISIRLFVSSLPLLTLLMHWANMSYFDDLSRVLKLSKQWVFALALLTSGLAAGGVFIFVFSYISGRSLGWEEILGFAVLLASFSAYLSIVRFIQVTPSGQRTLLISVGLWFAVFVAVFTSAQIIFYQLDALFVILLQSVVLVLFAINLTCSPRLPHS